MQGIKSSYGTLNEIIREHGIGLITKTNKLHRNSFFNLELLVPLKHEG
jgi:peptide subunit release factor RF-3